MIPTAVTATDHDSDDDKNFCDCRKHDKKFKVIILGTYTGILVAWPAYAKSTTLDRSAYVTMVLFPWSALKPGDKVQIHFRTEPYREKFLISREEPEAHIVELVCRDPARAARHFRRGRNDARMHYRWTFQTSTIARASRLDIVTMDRSPPYRCNQSHGHWRKVFYTYTAQTARRILSEDASGIHIYAASI